MPRGLKTGWQKPAMLGTPMKWVLLVVAVMLLPTALWGQSPEGQSPEDPSPEDALGRADGPVDRVWHEPPPRPSGASTWLPQPIHETAGTIAQMAGDTLRMESPSEDKPVYIAVDRIVWIEPAWSSPEAREGMQAFEERRYAESIPQLLKAVQLGPPPWQQQWLSAHLAMAATEANRHPAALELVGQLDRSGMPLPMLALLPIRWTSRPVEPAAVASARERIDAAEPAVRLVAASWLLSNTATRTRAERTLEALATDAANPWIARLAEAVLWRRTPVPRIESDAPGWLEKIDRLPIALQGGPLLCAADRLEAAGHGEQARELYLAAALLHRHPRPVADEAREAAQLNP